MGTLDRNGLKININNVKIFLLKSDEIITWNLTKV